MILASTQTTTPDSPFPIAPSRTADKFVLRIPKPLNEALADLARAQYRSFNNEVVQAVLSHIEGHRRVRALRDILIQRLSLEIGNAVLIGMELIPHHGDVLGEFPIRMPDGMRAKLKLGEGSMRETVAKACAEWVLYSQQIEALLARCADPDVPYPTS